MTRRLYYDDAYLTRFSAHIVERGSDPCEVYLDRTAFYPTSGGQPHDLGTINEVPVVDVVDDGVRIQHRLARAVETADVEGIVNWPRRFDHMQQHSGQHLLSAILNNLFEAPTVSFHLGREASTIDVGVESLSPEQVQRAEQEANAVAFENRPLSIAYEQASEVQDLRKPSEREGTLRIVSIEGLDRSACGGTHVRSTGEIGPILIRKLEKIRGSTRVEFLCGGRAVRRARADYDAILGIARLFSTPPDEALSLVTAQQSKLIEAEKAVKRLMLELAQSRGRALYHETPAGPAGVKRVVRELLKGPIPDDLRVEAQSFTSGQKALFAARTEDPPSLLLAVSDDLGLNAGNILKAALAEGGGRGGGNARIAQGSLPSVEALSGLWKKLTLL
jgi:alanyl-tRNA synthetase